jgi:hypothetical protein
MGKGIYTRGFLPHWDFDRSTQAITFRLADSVPAEVIKLWNHELDTMIDSNVRDIDHLHNCIAYIRNNPVKAALCDKPEDWPFSSAGVNWNGAPPAASAKLHNPEQAG